MSGVGAAATPGQLCSVLVPSCDAYADLWIPFFALFWRYWSDCPFPVYLGTNPVDGASGLALLHAAFPYIELATSEPDFARSSTDRRHGP